MAEGYLDTQNLSQCCGCGACADICPKDAIRMETGDDKGRYPRIDSEMCVHCGLCRTVCPIAEPLREDCGFPAKAFALVQEDADSRMRSASGGAFEVMAAALEERYPDLLVAGAAWDSPVTACHKLLPAKERAAFRKSKYLQSDCVGIYREVKSALEQGLSVFFTGTPCQVAALKKFVGMNRENLFTADLVCHGVPGPEILRAYTAELERKHKSPVVSVGFREKRKDLFGEVHSDYIKVVLANGKVLMGNKKTDAYLRGFDKCLFYRESCYNCPYAEPRRVSDVTIGDYWRIQTLFPERVDYTGVSAVLVNTPKGADMVSRCSNAWIRETDVSFLLKHNGRLRFPTKKHPRKEQFLAELDGKAFSVLIDQYVGKVDYLDNMLSGLLPGQLKRWIKNKGYKKWKKR